MRRVQLDQVESCLQSAFRGLGERPDNGLYSGEVQRDGLTIIFRETYRAGGHHVLPPALTGLEIPLLGSPGTRHTRFASGVRQLHSGACTLRVNKFDNPPQAGDVIVFPQPQVFGRDAPFGQHGGRFGKHQSSSAHRPAT
jgi:hypothetical protein